MLFGQRRTLAAVETGRAQIPVYVVDIPDDDQASEVARIIGQVAENDHRIDLKGSERAAAFQQLSVLGLTATQVARRTHRKVTEVRAGLAVAGSEAAAAALDKYELTLPQAAALAEFDEDADALRQLTTVAQQDPDQFDHAVSRLKAKRAEDVVRAQLAAELAELGVRLLPHAPYGDPSIARLDVLRSGDGDRAGIRSAQRLRGARRVPTGQRRWGGKVDIEPVYVCTEWRKHGHQDCLGDPITGMDSASGSGRMCDEPKTERRVVIANNKAWAGRTDRPTPVADRVSGPADRAEGRPAVDRGHAGVLQPRGPAGAGGRPPDRPAAAGLTDGTRPPSWGALQPHPHPVAEAAAATASPARAGMLTLGLLLGGLEAPSAAIPGGGRPRRTGRTSRRCRTGATRCRRSSSSCWARTTPRTPSP